MAYRDLTGDIIAAVPRIGYLNASNILTRAWRMLQDMRLWSFNVITDAQIFVPDAITAGTVSCVFNSDQVTADVTAKAALDAVVLSNPVLASGTLGLGRQIQVGSSPNGPLYDIFAYSTLTGIITLDRPYGEPTVAGTTYSCYKAFYAPPVNASNVPAATFVRYFSVRNVASGYSIRGRRLYYTQEQLNAIDPQRGATGDAYILAMKGVNSLGQPVHEYYPNPVNQRTYVAQMQIRWPTPSVTVALPQMPYALEEALLYLCKRLAGEWAMGNVSTYPELAGVNWTNYVQVQDKGFKEERIQCVKMDDEIAPQIAKLQGSVFDFPLGGSFLQNHDMSSFIPG